MAKTAESRERKSAASKSGCRNVAEYQMQVMLGLRFLRDYLLTRDRIEQPKLSHAALELAFTVQDPCGIDAVNLARELIDIVQNRTDEECRALLPAVQDLGRKFARSRG